MNYIYFVTKDFQIFLIVLNQMKLNVILFFLLINNISYLFFINMIIIYFQLIIKHKFINLRELFFFKDLKINKIPF